MYAIGTVFMPYSEQGFRNTLSAFSGLSTLALFAAYGNEMLGYRGFRFALYAICAVGLIGLGSLDLPKNITGGTVLYLVALVTISIISQARRGFWMYSSLFVATSVLLSFWMDFRGLLGYAAVFAAAMVGAHVLRPRAYWLVGIVGSVAIISATLWYFLNVNQNQLINDITRIVSETSGRRALSGRDWLWPAILSAVESSPLMGLGSGALPRDIMQTDLSAHNYYLQLYLQIGLVGLAILTSLLLVVWRRLAFGRSPAVQFGSALFLMFVAHNSTEVLMFQNGLIAAVPAWCAIGIAISVAMHESLAESSGFSTDRSSVRSRSTRGSPRW
ncbi:O-antigen ligase family protein [Agromyces bracchium]|uniref:O-antigen ligase family protein n=2 Tax=Agromyces bracchium TaxID=88376 RepID=UPI0035EBD221